MKLTRHLAIGIGITAIGVAVALAYFATGTAQVAPDVEYTHLDGKSSRVSDLKGKVVLLNFWATSCTTCVKEMPQIVATHQKYHARGYETLAVAMSYDPPAYVVNFAESRKLPFTVVIDNLGKMAHSFGDVKLTPTSILLNKRGEIVKRYVGEPDFAALHLLVEKLLADT
jgi:peroxiredoxin